MRRRCAGGHFGAAGEGEPAGDPTVSPSRRVSGSLLVGDAGTDDARAFEPTGSFDRTCALRVMVGPSSAVMERTRKLLDRVQRSYGNDIFTSASSSDVRTPSHTDRAAAGAPGHDQERQGGPSVRLRALEKAWTHYWTVWPAAGPGCRRLRPARGRELTASAPQAGERVGSVNHTTVPSRQLRRFTAPP